MANKIVSYIKKRAYSALLHLTYISDYAISPRNLSIEITDDCNLNCPMCPRRFAKITGKNMPLQRFKYILDVLPKVRNVILLGRGETLMNPDFFGILNLGKSKSRNIQFTIVTNGTLLTEKNINKLSNVARVVVSIDSPHPEGYKKIRGANLEVIINNLRRLKQLKKNIYLCIQALVMEENVENLLNFISLAQNANADEVTLINLIGFSQELDRKHSDNFTAVQYKLEKAKELAARNGIRLIATPTLSKPRHCFEPWLGPRISLNGDIYPCCYIYETSEPTWEEWYQGVCINVPQFKYKMGNIFEDSFKKIWNGNNYKLLRETVRKSEERNLLSQEELNERRKKINSNEKYSYCRVCIYRQNRAC